MNSKEYVPGIIILTVILTIGLLVSILLFIPFIARYFNSYEYYYITGNLIVKASLTIPSSLDKEAEHDYREDMREFDRPIEWIPEGVVWHPSYYYSENSAQKSPNALITEVKALLP